MRALLTSGIKAILAVAALSTAIHWALRLQRDADGLTTSAIASIADPVTTGSIASRPGVAAPAQEMRQAVAPDAPLAESRKAQPVGFDQSHLAALFASAAAAPKKPAKR